MPLPKGSNPNAPKRGSTIKVEPIRDLKAIKRIKLLLQDDLVKYGLFVVGINTAFRASDLVDLRVRELKGDQLHVRELKTKKMRIVSLNPPTLQVLQDLIKTRNLGPDDCFFEGQRGPFTVNYLHALVKRWCRDVGLKGNYGSHTLRKTFGYHQRVTFKVDLPLLMHVFGHASQKQTLTYLCIYGLPRKARRLIDRNGGGSACRRISGI